MEGYNTDLANQILILHKIIKRNALLYKLLSIAPILGLKQYYIGAGCIAQTVWNYQSGNDLMYGISDIDFVYFDADDLSSEKEERIAEQIVKLIDNKIKVDVKNGARVHIWYKSHFGYDIDAYTSIEHAINTWPTTATSVGIRLENDVLNVYAPFGLNDLFGKIIRANKAQITEEIYKSKTDKWLSKWSDLKIIPW